MMTFAPVAMKPTAPSVNACMAVMSKNPRYPEAPLVEKAALSPLASVVGAALKRWTRKEALVVVTVLLSSLDAVNAELLAEGTGRARDRNDRRDNRACGGRIGDEVSSRVGGGVSRPREGSRGIDEVPELIGQRRPAESKRIRIVFICQCHSRGLRVCFLVKPSRPVFSKWEPSFCSCS